MIKGNDGSYALGLLDVQDSMTGHLNIRAAGRSQSSGFIGREIRNHDFSDFSRPWFPIQTLNSSSQYTVSFHAGSFSIRQQISKLTVTGLLNPLGLDQPTAQLARTYIAPAFLVSHSQGWTSEGLTTTRSIQRMGRCFMQWVDTSVPLLNYGQRRFYVPTSPERD